MSQEIERKFLLSSCPELKSYTTQYIVQYYLLRCNPMVRVRATKNDTNWVYELCHKIGSGLVREEKEEVISSESFEILKNISKAVIEKMRYKVVNVTDSSNPNVFGSIEIDKFMGDCNGVIIAEREFISIENANKWIIPNWLQKCIIREVTDDVEYTNSKMATMINL